MINNNQFEIKNLSNTTETITIDGIQSDLMKKISDSVEKVMVVNKFTISTDKMVTSKAPINSFVRLSYSVSNVNIEYNDAIRQVAVNRYSRS